MLNRRIKIKLSWLIIKLLLSGGVSTSLKKTKKRLGRCLVESVMVYDSELWVENKSQENKLQAVEIDCL
jgi:hypothetical protein